MINKFNDDTIRCSFTHIVYKVSADFVSYQSVRSLRIASVLLRISVRGSPPPIATVSGDVVRTRNLTVLKIRVIIRPKLKKRTHFFI